MVTSANVYLKHILFWQGIMFMALSTTVSDRASIDGIRRKYAAE